MYSTLINICLYLSVHGQYAKEQSQIFARPFVVVNAIMAKSPRVFIWVALFGSFTHAWITSRSPMSIMHGRWAKKPLSLMELDDTPDTTPDPEDDGSVIARCPETKRVVECFVDSSVKVEEVDYFVLTPCDEVVALVAFDENDEPMMLDPESSQMDDIFPAAAALFEEDDIHLFRSAGCLTMQGDIDSVEFGDDYEEEDIDDEDDEDDDGGDGERVEVISEFEINDIPYSLVKIMEPVFLIAKAAAIEGEYVLLEEAERVRISPQVEKAIGDRGTLGVEVE